MIEYKAPAIKPVLSRLQVRRSGTVRRSFFITGRPEAIRDGTLDNLKAAGYKGKYELFLQPPSYAQRRLDGALQERGPASKIEKRGYKILANVGDQRSDLKGGYSERTYKLPNLDLPDSIEVAPALALGPPAGGAGAGAGAHRPGGRGALRPPGGGVGAAWPARATRPSSSREGRLPQARAARPGSRARALGIGGVVHRAPPTSSR